LSYGEVLAAELIEDGHTITRTSRTSQAATALVGGILFGGVGAVVGALTGSKSTRGKVKRVDVRLVINNADRPIFLLNFMNAESNAGGFIHKPALEKANEWLGRFKVIMAQADQADAVAQDSVLAPLQLPAPSLADEIQKLANLLDRGLLSREEFDAQKVKLLNATSNA